jgi:hypothetical protein
MFLLSFQKKVNILMQLIANLAGNRNNIEMCRDNRDRVEGPATTAVGRRREGVYRLTARSHVT